MTRDHDSELAALIRRFPRWEAWKGVTGTCYARLPGSSPPVVVHGKDADDLARQVQAAEDLLAHRQWPRTGRPADQS